MKTFLRLGTVLVLSVGASCGGGGGGRHGTLYFSQDENANGLYVLNTSTGAATLVGLGETGTSGSTIGLTETDDPAVLIGSTYTELFLVSADGSGASAIDPSTVQAEGLAFHRPNGLLYAIINQTFVSVDPSTGDEVETLSSPPVDVEGLASDYDDRIFAFGFSSNLYVYDISDDSWDVVGDTGIQWGEGAGLAYDPDAKILYAVCADGGGDNLYRMDPNTAQTTLIGPTGVTPTSGGLAFVPD